MTAEENDKTPGEIGQANVTESRTTTAPTKIAAGDPGNEGSDEERRVIGDPAAPLSPINDPSGERSNRIGGTVQSEPTPEQLPPDAKVAPVFEQVAPNQAAIAVGAQETPEEIAGVPTVEEGEKNLVSDTADPTQFLSPESNQHPAAERAAATQQVVAEDAAEGATPAVNPEGKSKSELESESETDKPTGNAA